MNNSTINIVSLRENRIELNNKLVFMSTVLFNGKGTGFFYKFNVNNKDYYSIITNDHILKSINKESMITYKIYKEIQKEYITEEIFDSISIKINEISERVISLQDKLENKKEQYDLCMIILKNGFIYEVKHNFIISDKTLGDGKIINRYIGFMYPDIKMIGFPFAKGPDPHMRDGIISSPIKINQDPDDLLIGSIKSIGGSSGSPVFAQCKRKSDNLDYVIFIGISVGYICCKSDICMVDDDNNIISNNFARGPGTFKCKENSGLTNIINCNQLRKFERFI